MMLDLSALEDKSPSTAEPSGKPLDIPLTDIEEDPNQPRTEFSAEAMEEMTASIKARGVRQPVSVRPHPSKAGKWMLNFGARRYRGSKAAGKTSIPAFVDDTSEDFDQVIENEQRDNLKPMELALFIQRKLETGVKKAEIARKLGKPASVITEHLSLVSPPPFLEKIYRDARCTSPKTLYELRALHDQFPEDVEAWCASVEDVTRKGVTALATQLKKPEQTKTESASANKTLSNERNAADSSSQPGEETARESKEVAREPSAERDADFKGDDKKSKLSHAAAKDSTEDSRNAQTLTTSGAENKKAADAVFLERPLLLVKYQDRLASLLMNRRPTKSGFVHIRYEDGGGEEEVPALDCTMNELIER